MNKLITLEHVLMLELLGQTEFLRLQRFLRGLDRTIDSVLSLNYRPKLQTRFL
jgi:hypothetical protein